MTRRGLFSQRRISRLQSNGSLHRSQLRFYDVGKIVAPYGLSFPCGSGIDENIAEQWQGQFHATINVGLQFGIRRRRLVPTLLRELLTFAGLEQNR